MHEKVQLERLLDGLLGPDWLKVMGITGVTDGERKDWEGKRMYFVREVRALVDKFRVWKEEEKRVRLEREGVMKAKEEEGEQEEGTEEGSERRSEAGSEGLEHHLHHVHLHEHSDHHHSHRKPHSEPPAKKPRRPPRPQGFVLPIEEPLPTTPFVSFFKKPHLRDAALGKHRHGRKVFAFGCAVPEVDEKDFVPPEEYLTEEALKDHARKKRRMRREKKE